MKTIFASIILSLNLSSAFGQQFTPGSGTLTCTSITAKNNGTTIGLNSTFVITGNEKIEWTQSSGNEQMVYDITSIEGTWTDLSTQGEIRYNVTAGSRSSIIFFYRDSEGLKIQIQTLRNGVNMVPFEFLISSTSQSN